VMGFSRSWDANLRNERGGMRRVTLPPQERRLR
jgi:hypothetical protein